MGRTRRAQCRSALRPVGGAAQVKTLGPYSLELHRSGHSPWCLGPPFHSSHPPTSLPTRGLSRLPSLHQLLKARTSVIAQEEHVDSEDSLGFSLCTTHHTHRWVQWLGTAGVRLGSPVYTPLFLTSRSRDVNSVRVNVIFARLSQA